MASAMVNGSGATQEQILQDLILKTTNPVTAWPYGNGIVPEYMTRVVPSDKPYRSATNHLSQALDDTYATAIDRMKQSRCARLRQSDPNSTSKTGFKPGPYGGCSAAALLSESAGCNTGSCSEGTKRLFNGNKFRPYSAKNNPKCVGGSCGLSGKFDRSMIGGNGLMTGKSSGSGLSVENGEIPGKCKPCTGYARRRRQYDPLNNNMGSRGRVASALSDNGLNIKASGVTLEAKYRQQMEPYANMNSRFYGPMRSSNTMVLVLGKYGMELSAKSMGNPKKRPQHKSFNKNQCIGLSCDPSSISSTKAAAWLRFPEQVTGRVKSNYQRQGVYVNSGKVPIPVKISTSFATASSNLVGVVAPDASHGGLENPFTTNVSALSQSLQESAMQAQAKTSRLAKKFRYAETMRETNPVVPK